MEGERRGRGSQWRDVGRVGWASGEGEGGRGGQGGGCGEEEEGGGVVLGEEGAVLGEDMEDKGDGAVGGGRGLGGRAKGGRGGGRARVRLLPQHEASAERSRSKK